MQKGVANFMIFDFVGR